MSLLHAFVRSSRLPQSSGAGSRLPHFITLHKKLSVIVSLVVLTTASAAAITLASDSHTDASGTSGTSAHVQSTSSQLPANSAAGAVPSSENSASVSVNNTGTDDSTADNNSSTQVTVNGQNIPVPENGTVEQTVPGNNNQSDVHISISKRSSDNQQNSDSTVQISSTSNSTTGGGSSTQ